MRQETFLEKSFRDILPPELGADVHVSFGYQDNLRIIQKHLQTFYGTRSDWSQCIKSYLHSNVYQSCCHSASNCEEIPIITVDQLYTMIQEDDAYHSKTRDFLQLNQTIHDAGAHANLDDIFRAAMILGICPDQNVPGLFNWLISREGLSEREQQDIRNRVIENIGLFAFIIDLFSTLFVPGIQLTFPLIGTAMTQKKSKFFYRGENSFYGSSKPGIYRSASRISPMQKLANHLILDEACFFLDQFDAVQKWGLSSVNYFALAQHYGIKTPLIDITSDLKTALFFACCTYEDYRWRPMKKKDFVNMQGSAGVRDSRYGILYRSPTEITDMNWALANDEAGAKLITPIDYQPFMRCSAQHGYMLYGEDESYDLLQDPLFDKFRIEHDEDFCKWIFEEMDCGAKVYPHEDIPKIEHYMEEIRNANFISQSTFDCFAQQSHYSEHEAQAVKQRLQKEGYTVISGQVEHIHNNKLRKINKQYCIDVAYSKVDIPATSRPMITLASDTLVEPIGSSEQVLATGKNPNAESV